MTNIINQTAYLKTSRNFPKDAVELAIELDKAYVDIANAVNAKTIGLFPVNKSAVTGESWFVKSNNRQQTLRQIYTSSGATAYANIAHGLSFSEFDGFTRIFGTYTDGTNWYALTPGSTVAIAGQVGFYLTTANIVFTIGAGAPAAGANTRVRIVLEWLSKN